MTSWLLKENNVHLFGHFCILSLAMLLTVFTARSSTEYQGHIQEKNLVGATIEIWGKAGRLFALHSALWKVVLGQATAPFPLDTALQVQCKRKVGQLEQCAALLALHHYISCYSIFCQTTHDQQYRAPGYRREHTVAVHSKNGNASFNSV